jgi:hypothetical protein
MELRAPKPRLWLVALTMTVSTLAAAQSRSAPAVSTAPGSGASPDLHADLSTNDPAVVGSRLNAMAPTSLPDAPSAVSQAPQDQVSPPSAEPKQEPRMPPTNRSFGVTFVAANGVLLGSTIANAEMIARCRPSACQAIPDSIRSRAALYGIGIPASLAVSYISYRLKRGGTRWWIAPVAVLATGNVAYAVHAAQWSH